MCHNFCVAFFNKSQLFLCWMQVVMVFYSIFLSVNKDNSTIYKFIVHFFLLKRVLVKKTSYKAWICILFKILQLAWPCGTTNCIFNRDATRHVTNSSTSSLIFFPKTTPYFSSFPTFVSFQTLPFHTVQFKLNLVNS